MNKYIGIDNGLDGAIVCVDEEGALLFKGVMPVVNTVKSKREYDVPVLKQILLSLSFDDTQLPFPPNCSVVIEKAQSMPGQGSSSMFKIGRGFGLIEGIVATLGYKYAIVHPKTWQKEVFRDVNHDDTKQASVIVAKRLWPNQDWRATERSKNPHDGLTDAACMAEYGRRILK